ncbi:MAG: sensor histidine kinase [Acidiferrobacterales bacterium]
MGVLSQFGAELFDGFRVYRRAEATKTPPRQASIKKPFNLLRSFAFLSLLSILLIGVVSALVLSRFLSHRLLERDAVVTMEFVQSIVEAEEPRLASLDSELFKDSEGLGEFLVHIARIPDVVRANVYAPDGVVVWSTDKVLISKQFESNPELEAALAGELVFEFYSRDEVDKEEHAFLADDVTEFIETYIPIWDVGRTKIVGVAEVYKVPSALFRAINEGHLLVWGGGLLGGIFLYAVLFGIVRHAHNVIHTQEARLRQEISDHKRDKHILRVSERKLRNLGSQMLMVQEQERKRIAGELHDGIGQSLTAIKFGIESAHKTLEAEAPAVNLDKLTTLVNKTKDAIEESQRIAMDLRPSMLDDLGIVATIDWFCREFQSVYPHITVTKRVNLKEDIVDGTLKTVLYRIIQEALNNVAKHAQAGRIALTLETVERQIRLRIQDDGRGFDRAAVSSAENGRRGLGLPGMCERAELSGGSFSVESDVGRGTLIEARWPQPAKRGY